MLSSGTWDALSTLKLARRPVAVGFLDSPPPGMAPIDRAAAAGCGYWKLAAEGQEFYTVSGDHQNCPVGAYTHGVTLTAAKAEELQSLVGTMIQLQYLSSDEVPAIPHRAQPMQVAAYGPADSATFAADVVIFSGNARQIMLLSEAARAAGSFESGTTMGRPACAMLPQAIGTATGVASIGCIGNRVYTELPDEELYFTVPAASLAAMLDKLHTIVNANVELEKFHRMRAATLGA
ncbi:MAG: DUF169 domain-containing protein [Acidobacteriota bacterium]